MENRKIVVMGAGGWGTALSMVLAQRTEVLLWCYEKETIDEIEMNRTNSDFLPGVELHNNIVPISEFDAIKDADVIFNTIPTQHIREIYSQINFPLDKKIIVNGSKGLENNTFKRISEIFSETVDIKPSNYVNLSGPSHAEEVAKGVPTAVLAASTNFDLVKTVRELLTTDVFRVYSSADVIGCEFGGALKNIIAIAYGIVDGLGFGDNTKATVITRGLAEISRLGLICGANPLTFTGLSGLGDLVVTCISKYSRNREFGKLIAQGYSISDIHNRNKMVAEGVPTTESAYHLSKKLDAEMPITEEIYKILYQNANPKDSVYSLYTRESKNEIW
jgi:glycerol-3-phosphate dehydrogenase (NAD(P)+)